MVMTTMAAIIFKIAYARRWHGRDKEDDNKFRLCRAITCTLLLKLPCVVWTSFALKPGKDPANYIWRDTRKLRGAA